MNSKFKQIIDNVSIDYKSISERGVAYPKWPDPTANHYRVLLKYNGKQWTVVYSMGRSHKNGPKKLDVLYGLMMDAQCYENARKWEDFRDDMGYDKYDPDAEAESRQAFYLCKKTYQNMNGDFFSRAEYKIISEGFQDY